VLNLRTPPEWEQAINQNIYTFLLFQKILVRQVMRNKTFYADGLKKLSNK